MNTNSVHTFKGLIDKFAQNTASGSSTVSMEPVTAWTEYFRYYTLFVTPVN